MFLFTNPGRRSRWSLALGWLIAAPLGRNRKRSISHHFNMISFTKIVATNHFIHRSNFKSVSSAVQNRWLSPRETF